MNRSRKRTITSVATATLVAGVTIGGLSACGLPPSTQFQQQTQQSGQIPPGGVVVGGSVHSDQTTGWTEGTGGAVDFGK